MIELLTTTINPTYIHVLHTVTQLQNSTSCQWASCLHLNLADEYIVQKCIWYWLIFRRNAQFSMDLIFCAETTKFASNGHNIFLETDTVHGTFCYRNNGNGAPGPTPYAFPAPDVYILGIRWVIHYDLFEMGL